MELGSSWEVVIWAATQEFHNILWNPKVHHRVHKSPPLIPLLSHIDPVNTIKFYLSKIYLNIILPTYIYVFLVVSFRLAFPPKSYTQ
jgi:hypothetical protein